MLILPAETEVHAKVWTLKQSDEAVRSETSTHRNMQPELARGNAALQSYNDQWSAALKKLEPLKDKTDSSSIDTYNGIITEIDELRAKFIRQQEALDGMTTREGEVEEARAKYISGVMDAQTKAEALAATYATLAHDSPLQTAIVQASGDTQPPLVLGPSLAFRNDLDFLRQAAKKIVSAWVLVPKTSVVGGLHVLPILDGTLTTSMVWDSGCSVTQLSAETARKLNLNLTNRDATVDMMVVSGAIIKERLINIESIQLGPFTLKHVQCIVGSDEPDAPPVPDLLGNSFQSHFLSRLDQQNGRLQLTPIDSSVEISSISAPAFSPSPVHHVDPQNPDLARQATATASSTAAESDPSGAIDGKVGGAPQTPQNEWVCDDPTGSITLTWDHPVTLSGIKLWDRLDPSNHILSGRLVFEDGSAVVFGELPGKGLPLAMRFAPRTTHWMRVDILTVSPGTTHPGFAEIAVFK